MTGRSERPRRAVRWLGVGTALLLSVLVHGALLGKLDLRQREPVVQTSVAPLWAVPVQAQAPPADPTVNARPDRREPVSAQSPRRPMPPPPPSIPPGQPAAADRGVTQLDAVNQAQAAEQEAVAQDPAQPPGPDGQQSANAAEQPSAAMPGPVPATSVAEATALPSDPTWGVSAGAAPSLTDEAPGGGTVPASPLPRLPASHAQQFRVYWGDYEGGQSVARVRYRLTVDGDRYALRTEGEAEGLISLVYTGTLTQFSTGLMGADGLSPERYVESRGRRGERTVAFEGVPRQLRPQGAPAAAIAPGTQDRLSVFYQLGLLARADPALFAAGQTVSVPVASLRDVRLERFLVIGEEVLMAPGGPIRALRLHRAPPFGSRDPRIDLWLGYDHQMLPVRLRVEDGSRRVLDQLLEPAG